MKVSVVGVGLMGGPIADHLVSHGHQVTVYDPVPDAVAARVEAGATAATSPAEAARGAQVICLVVRDDHQALDAVAGPDGVLAGAAPGTVLLVHATVSLATVRALGERCVPAGVRLVDAGISGGVDGATAGTLTVMCGGEPDDVEATRPVLDCFAGQVVHFGALGTGMAAKLARNLAHYTVWTGLDAARELAEAAGLDRDAFAHLIRTTGVPELHRLVLERPRPPRQPDGSAPVAGEHTRAFVELGWKDLDDVRALAQELGVDTTMADAARRRHGPSMGLNLLPPPEGPHPS